ncbi:MAG: hypothetical protein Q8P93_02290 [bacterium]|nr:hypothetical protein [bacterium]
MIARHIFKPERLGDFAHTLGRFGGEFRKGRDEIERQAEAIKGAIVFDTDKEMQM